MLTVATVGKDGRDCATEKQPRNWRDEETPEPKAKQPDAEGIWQGDRTKLALLVLLIGLAILAWYWKTTESMVSTWERSGTFAHGFLVFPISIYLAWRCRSKLATIAPTPYWPALALIIGAGFAWLLGELGSVVSVSQFAIVGMLPLIVWTVFGTRFVKVLSFPLTFLIFAVPFGEFMLPTMMNWTADITVLALRLSAVPVFREGNNFVIPSGQWSVVEACSGVRYLIASMMVGSLFAYLSFYSWSRRVLFFAMSIAVPLLANWLRAYIIVMLGHLSNNAIATGVDHLVYGWIFFGVVMLLMFWIGSRWQDREHAYPEDVASSGTVILHRATPTVKMIAALLVATLAASIWKPIAPMLNASNSPPVEILSAIEPGEGWSASDAPVADWRPHFGTPNAELIQTFAKDSARVGFYLAFYRNQSQGRELISSVNTIAPTTDKHWLRGVESNVALAVGGANLEVLSTDIRGPAKHLYVWRWYWVNGQLTSNDHVAKALLIWSKLLGRGDDSAVIALYTIKDRHEDASSATLKTFVKNMWPNIEEVLLQAHGR